MTRWLLRWIHLLLLLIDKEKYLNLFSPVESIFTIYFASKIEEQHSFIQFLYVFDSESHFSAFAFAFAFSARSDRCSSWTGWNWLSSPSLFPLFWSLLLHFYFLLFYWTRSGFIVISVHLRSDLNSPAALISFQIRVFIDRIWSPSMV